jgi:hypothetical protein
MLLQRETGRGRESFSGNDLTMWEVDARKRLPTPFGCGPAALRE